jgi:hypothetical protein
MKIVTLNKRSLLASLGLVAVLAGLLVATVSAAPPSHPMTLAEACALPDTRCFPLPSGSGVWTMPAQTDQTVPASAGPNLRSDDPLRDACARVDTRCFPLPSGPARWDIK